MESVKLQNGSPDLSALLRDDVELATGRMSVSDQSSSPQLQIKIIPILLLVCGSQTIVRSICGALQFPVCSPLSAANGGPSVTLHIESFGYA
jgi:ferric-chelate reductase